MTLTKRDLARAIHRSEPGISIAAAVALVDSLLTAVKRRLSRHEKVMITNFGTFEVVDRAPRRGINPSTGLRMTIDGHRAVTFRPAPALLEALDD